MHVFMGIFRAHMAHRKHTPPGLVQAPSRLTTLRWCPMWLRIFSSVIRALCSLAVAPSGGQKAEKEKSCTNVFTQNCHFKFNRIPGSWFCTFEHLNSHCPAAGGVVYTNRRCLHHLTKGSAAQRLPWERKKECGWDWPGRGRCVFVSNWATLLITIIIHPGRKMLIK